MKIMTIVVFTSLMAATNALAQAEPGTLPPNESPAMQRSAEPMTAPASWNLPPEGLCATPCAPNAPRCFLEADYLVWWVKRAPLPAPLSTTDPNVTLANLPDLSGALGTPGTQTLINSSDMNYGAFSGLRVRGGWVAEPFSLELSGFLLEYRNATDSVVADSFGFPFISQTFFDVANNREDAYFISVPFGSTGTVSVTHPIQFYGAQANIGVDLGGSGHWTYNAFAGFRFQALDEHLTIDAVSTSLVDQAFPLDAVLFYLGQPVFFGGTVAIQDSFRTSNRFYGGQVGGSTRWFFHDAFSLLFRGSIAFGVNQQTVDIQGQTNFFPGDQDVPPADLTVPGGIYAQPSNSGRFFRKTFSVIPEGELTAEWRVAANWTLKLGYSFMYWTNVVRPGGQFDRRLNRQAVPTDPNFTGVGPATAPFTFQNSDFWAQGFIFGLEWRF